jgi:hypothetical protein
MPEFPSPPVATRERHRLKHARMIEAKQPALLKAFSLPTTLSGSVNFKVAVEHLYRSHRL